MSETAPFGSTVSCARRQFRSNEVRTCRCTTTVHAWSQPGLAGVWADEVTGEYWHDIVRSACFERKADEELGGHVGVLEVAQKVGDPPLVDRLTEPVGAKQEHVAVG